MKPAGDFWEAEAEHQDYPEHYPSGFTCHYVRPNWGDRRSSIGKRVRETEAEATAFVVCQSVGLETGSAASDYIQLWNGDVQVLTKSLGYIRRAASQMLETLTDG